MSLSLPPSYTSLPPGYASTSGSTTSPLIDPDKDKSDLRSIASGYSAASTVRTHMSSRSDALLKLAIIDTDPAKSTAPIKLIRRAKCPPEFLEEIAKSGVPHDFKTRAESQFKVINGLEAEALFDHFVGLGDQMKYSDLDDLSHLSTRPLVFAITFIDAGRKVVDYYMTWRGKIPRIRDLRERRLSFLDSEFRRVARSLDKHYKRIISIVDNSSPVSGPSRMPDAPKRAETPPPEPPPKDERAVPDDAASATDSVISLPLLNMIRNVPFSNRLTLRVTNPDNASILSSDGIIEGAPTLGARILDTIAEVAEAVATVTAVPLTESPTSVQSSPREKRLSGAHRSNTRVSASAPQSPEGEKRRSNTDSGRSRRRHKHRRDDDRQYQSDDDASSQRSRKRRHRRHAEEDYQEGDADSDDTSEFTIVLLDDNAEKDLLSWHGLNRTDANYTPRSSTTTLLGSPWAGPLVSANRLIFHQPPRPIGEVYSDESSDDDDDGSYEYECSVILPPNGPSAAHQYPSPASQVPLTLSYAGSSGSSYSSGSSNGGRPASRASFASYRTAYTYPHPTAPASYVPAWINPRHFTTPEMPLAAMQTPLSYHTRVPY